LVRPGASPASGGGGHWNSDEVRVEWINKLLCELLGILVKGLRRSTGSGCKSREELSGPAAMAVLVF
jgi:hypothetical protein